METRLGKVCRRGKSAPYIQGGSNITGTNCELFTHNQSRSYLNHLVYQPDTNTEEYERMTCRLLTISSVD